MSYIPDCRTDEFYNEKYLVGNDKMFLAGYDWAVEQITTLFYNLEVYPELVGLLEGHEEELESALRDYAEMGRNELVTSMIDGMTDEEFEEIKAKVDSEE